MSINSTGETRLGLMWTCMTLYNRPQVCFTPELQPEWLIALMCIFVGCICITTTIILLASSNWDRDVIPYARWVGFTASKFNRLKINTVFLNFIYISQWFSSVWPPSSFRWASTSTRSAANPISCPTPIRSESRTLCSCWHFG